MIKLSELISKEIISIYECQRIGTISGVCFNKTYNKIDGYVFFDDESEFDNYISNDKIYSLSQEGIFIRNTSKIETANQESNSPVNKKVYSINGTYFGKICDAVIDLNSNLLYFLTDQQHKIYVKNFINVGDIILLKQDDKKISLSNFKPKESFNDISYNNVKVKIVSMEQSDLNKKYSFPTKLIANTNNLIGKKSKSTLFGFNNEIIVKENQIINDNIVKTAKKHNKISELLYITDWSVLTHKSFFMCFFIF